MNLHTTSTIPSHWQLLMNELNICNPTAVLFIISCFNDYASNFLFHQPANVLDPHFPDIRARINLTLENPGVAFGWTNWHQLRHNPHAEQADHSAAFVIRLMQYAAGTYGFQQSAYELLGDESILKEMHVMLCKLQSIWLGISDAWVDNERTRGSLYAALRRALREI